MDSLKRVAAWGIWLVLVVTAVSGRAAQTMSLDDLLDVAMEQNGVILAAQRDLAAKQIGAQKVWSMILTQIDVEGAYRRSDEAIERFGQRIVPEEQSAIGLMVDQPLMRPEFFPRHAESMIVAKIALEGYSQRVQETLLQVADAYTNVLRLQNLLNQARSAEKAALEINQRIQAMYRAGTVTEDIALKAALDYKAASLKVSDRELNLSLAQRELSALVNMDIRQVDLIPPSQTLPDISNNITQAVTTALEHRHDYKAAALEVARSKNALKAVKAQFFPTLTGRMTMSAIENPRYDEQDESWTASLVFRLPLVERGMRWFDLRQSREIVQRALLDQENKKQSVILEVEKAHADAIVARDRFSLLEKQYEWAQTNYQRVKNLFEKGSAVTAELSSALAQMDAAEVEMINGRFDFWTAFLHFEAACGVFGAQQIESRLERLRSGAIHGQDIMGGDAVSK